MENYYRSNYLLKKPEVGGFSLTELDNLIPFEKEIYMMLAAQDLEEKRQMMDKPK